MSETTIEIVSMRGPSKLGGRVRRQRDAQRRISRVPRIRELRSARAALRNGRVLRVSRDDRWRSASPCVHDDCIAWNEDRHRSGEARGSMTDRADRVDVLVIGGGPAGMAAAAYAAERGTRVLLVDEGTRPGGQIWRESLTKPAPAIARRWSDRLAASGARSRRRRRSSMCSSRIAPASCHGERKRRIVTDRCASVDSRNGRARTISSLSGLDAPERLWSRRRSGAAQDGNVVSRTASRDCRVGAVAATGRRVSPRGGGFARSVAEQAAARRVAGFAASLWRSPSMLIEAARLRSTFMTTSYATGTWITEARGSSSAAKAVVTDGRTKREISCDIVCAAFGLVPNTELARLVGCVVSDGVVRVDDQQATTVRDVFCAGEPTGIGGVELGLIEGEIAGNAVTGSPIPDRLVARRRMLCWYAHGSRVVCAPPRTGRARAVGHHRLPVRGRATS